MTTLEITCSVAYIGAFPFKTNVNTDLEMVPLPFFIMVLTVRLARY